MPIHRPSRVQDLTFRPITYCTPKFIDLYGTCTGFKKNSVLHNLGTEATFRNY